MRIRAGFSCGVLTYEASRLTEELARLVLCLSRCARPWVCVGPHMLHTHTHTVIIGDSVLSDALPGPEFGLTIASNEARTVRAGCYEEGSSLLNCK